MKRTLTDLQEYVNDIATAYTYRDAYRYIKDDEIVRKRINNSLKIFLQLHLGCMDAAGREDILQLSAPPAMSGW